jgi:hypothetical protein
MPCGPRPGRRGPRRGASHDAALVTPATPKPRTTRSPGAARPAPTAGARGAERGTHRCGARSARGRRHRASARARSGAGSSRYRMGGRCWLPTEVRAAGCRLRVRRRSVAELAGCRSGVARVLRGRRSRRAAGRRGCTLQNACPVRSLRCETRLNGVPRRRVGCRVREKTRVALDARRSKASAGNSQELSAHLVAIRRHSRSFDVVASRSVVRRRRVTARRDARRPARRPRGDRAATHRAARAPTENAAGGSPCGEPPAASSVRPSPVIAGDRR